MSDVNDKIATGRQNRKKNTGWAPPWQKGQSGNPGGRPKAALDVQALARSHTIEAIAALARGLRDPKHYPTCAQAILDRGWGKPIQEQHVTSEASLTVLHILAARALSSELKAIEGGSVDTDVVEATSVDTQRPRRGLHLTADQPEE